MIQKLKHLISSTNYIIIIYTITFISWLLGGDFFDIVAFSPFNIYGIFILILLLSFTLIIEENTLFSIPILSGFLFIISNSSINFDTLNTFGLPYIALGLIIVSLLIHIFKFKRKIRLGGLFIGLLLISIAYLIPLIYTETTLNAYAISGIGLIYLLFYVFLTTNTKGNNNYLFKLMIAISVLLILQLSVKIFRGIFDHPEMSFLEVLNWGMNHNWGPNFGWANINDVAFYLTLMFPSYIYFLFKYPRRISNWLFTLVPIVFIAISGSRGGMIGFSIVLIASLIILVIRGHKAHYIGLGIAFVTSLLVFFIAFDVFKEAWNVIIATLSRGSINNFSSSRIFIYQKGIEIFQMHPIFGSGWMSIDLVGANWRLFMFHSTIIHVLATMGLFGLFALLVHYYQVFNVLYTNFTLEKQLIFVGYIATQIHGLIDNVQFSVPYSFLIVFIFVIIETDPNPTVFKKVGRKYYFDPSLAQPIID